MTDIEDGRDKEPDADAASEPSPACPLCDSTEAFLDDWNGNDRRCVVRDYRCDCGARFSSLEFVSLSHPIWVPPDQAWQISDRTKRPSLRAGSYYVRLDPTLVLCYERPKESAVGYWEGLIAPDPFESCRRRERVMIGPADDKDPASRERGVFSFAQAAASPRLVRMRELSDIRTREKQKVSAAILARKARDAAQGLGEPPE